MKKKPSQAPFRMTRLGRASVEDQVRQAVASVSLEGLKPTDRAVELVRAIASGEITGETALNSLRGYHGRHA